MLVFVVEFQFFEVLSQEHGNVCMVKLDRACRGSGWGNPSSLGCMLALAYAGLFFFTDMIAKLLLKSYK